MGNHNYRESMYNAIEKSRQEKIVQIVQAFPQVLDEDLSSDSRVTPLARAVWRGDYDITLLLLKLGAKINNGGSPGVTPVMWAAKRDNAYMISTLIDFHADLTLKSNEGFNALDYAIVHGNYRPALFLYDFFGELKDELDYKQFAQDRDYRYVNYEIFLAGLKEKISYLDVPDFFKRPEKPKYADPVVDPREPWKKMVSRIIEFEDPPIVERTSLPVNLQPQNRFWGKVRQYVNGLEVEPNEQQIQKIENDEVQYLKEEQKQSVIKD